MTSTQHLKKTIALCAFAASSFSSSAWACGGLFCNQSTPVNQAAERIIFSLNDDATVTQVVEIQYEGPAESFAWILPVPGTPSVDVASTVSFDRLQAATNPIYQLSRVLACDAFAESDGSLGTGGSSSGQNGGGPKVVVLDSGSVGPYDYETISVDSSLDDPAQAAIDWLKDNGYDVTSTTPEVLRPYLEKGLNLIAFRLSKNASAGAIRPLSLTYQGRQAAIPIVPTSVAANDDMGVMVWMLADARAIPLNYYALELNDALINWFNPNSNYNEVVTQAANEAGGQGFVTEIADSAANYENQILSAEERPGGLLSYRNSSIQEALTYLSLTYGTYDGYIEALEDNVPLRDGITPAEFISCPDCYFYPEDYGFVEGFGGAASQMPIDESDPIFGTDLDKFIDVLEDDVMQPLRDVAELVGAAKVMTRLYTTMSAHEMSRDPVFDINADAPMVSRFHQATQDLSCDRDTWKVTLEDGSIVYGSGVDWPITAENSGLPYNARILEYSTSGDPSIFRSNREQIQNYLRQERAKSPIAEEFEDELATSNKGDGGGGCSTGSRAPLAGGSFALLLSLGALSWFRRRRSGSVA